MAAAVALLLNQQCLSQNKLNIVSVSHENWLKATCTSQLFVTLKTNFPWDKWRWILVCRSMALSYIYKLLHLPYCIKIQATWQNILCKYIISKRKFDIYKRTYKPTSYDWGSIKNVGYPLILLYKFFKRWSFKRKLVVSVMLSTAVLPFLEEAKNTPTCFNAVIW